MITAQLHQYTLSLGESCLERTFCCEACGGEFPEDEECRSLWSNSVCAACVSLHPCDVCGELLPRAADFSFSTPHLCPRCKSK